MSELRLGAPGSATVVMRNPNDGDQSSDVLADFVADVRAPGLEATSYVRSLHGAADLIGFLEGLAGQWRGWSGERTWESLEGDLRVVATHDGRSHVRLHVILRESYRPDAWTASVVIEIEAGEELMRLARDARDSLTP